MTTVTYITDSVFPARAGMSPPIVPEEDTLHCFPRASGDEPRERFSCRSNCRVFPARAGMSPHDARPD